MLNAQPTMIISGRNKSLQIIRNSLIPYSSFPCYDVIIILARFPFMKMTVSFGALSIYENNGQFWRPISGEPKALTKKHTQKTTTTKED